MGRGCQQNGSQCLTVSPPASHCSRASRQCLSRAGWVSILVLRWLQKQCIHRAQGLTVRCGASRLEAEPGQSEREAGRVLRAVRHHHHLVGVRDCTGASDQSTSRQAGGQAGAPSTLPSPILSPRHALYFWSAPNTPPGGRCPLPCSQSPPAALVIGLPQQDPPASASGRFLAPWPSALRAASTARVAAAAAV